MLKGFLLCHLHFHFHWNSLSRINSPWMYLYILLKSNAVLTHEDTNLKHKHIHTHRILKQLFLQLSISHLIKFVKSPKQFKSVSRVFYRVNSKFTWYKLNDWMKCEIINCGKKWLFNRTINMHTYVIIYEMYCTINAFNWRRDLYRSNISYSLPYEILQCSKF